MKYSWQTKVLFLAPIIILLIFIASLWDTNYYVGGDQMLPLDPQDNIVRSLYLWEQRNGGFSFFKYMLLGWQSVFYVLSLTNLPVFIIHKVFIVLIYGLGLVFTVASYRELFKGTRYGIATFALISGFIFLLNPSSIHVLVGSVPLYGFPICTYFFIKYLNTKNLMYSIPFAVGINIAFLGDLPQAKLPLVFAISLLFILGIYLQIRQIKLKELFLPLVVFFFVSLLFNVFAIVPFVNDIFGQKNVYQEFSSKVTVYGGDADLYSAALPYIIRFFNSNLINKTTRIGLFLSDPFFILWTFGIWVLLVSRLLFTRTSEEKRLLYSLLLPIIFFIFIAKGANPPFGEIYRIALAKIPFFKIFRTTSTIVIGGTLFFSFLVTITLYSYKKYRRFIFSFLLIHILIFHPIYLGYKLHTDFNIDQRGFQIPAEYFSLGTKLDQDKRDVKVISLPLDDTYVYKKWRYQGQSLLSWITRRPFIHTANTSLSFLNEPLSYKSLCSISSYYAVGSIVYEKDSIVGQDNVTGLFPADESVADNQLLKLFQVPGECLSPHFYIPNDLMYFAGENEDIADLANLPTMYPSTGIITGKNKRTLQELKKMLPTLNGVIVQAVPQFAMPDVLGRKSVRVALDTFKEDVVYYPYVRVRPNSLLYPYILLKEKSSLQSKKEPRARFDRHLFYALKRVSEISTWGVNNSWWQDSLEKYRYYVEEAIKLSSDLHDKQEGLQIIIGHVNANRQKVQEMSKKTYWEREKVDTWEEVFMDLKKKVIANSSFARFDNFTFSFLPPEGGTYTLYQLNSRVPQEGVAFVSRLDENPAVQITDVSRYEPKKVGEFTLDTAVHNVKTDVASVNLLDSKSWERFTRDQEVTQEEDSLLFTDDENKDAQVPRNIPVVFQQVNNWEPNFTYVMNVKYRIHDTGSLGVVVKERRKIFIEKDSRWVEEDNILLNERFGESNEFVALINSDPNSLSATAYVYGKDGLVSIDDVELKKLVIPKFFLVKESQIPPVGPESLPKLTFFRINPTKYKVRVEHANSRPYLLVFSETFDSGWKAYITGEEEKQQVKDKNVLATYFNGQVTEGEHENVFLAKDTFETWGKTPLPEPSHLKVNGYANAWWITPEDSHNASSYEIIVEYVPQRLLYIGGGISILSVVGLLVYSVFTVYSKKREIQ